MAVAAVSACGKSTSKGGTPAGADGGAGVVGVGATNAGGSDELPGEAGASAGAAAGASGSLPIDACGAPLVLGEIVPLYAESDAKNGPITTRLDDGTLVTRAAGRVRNRHEKESTFNTYAPNYYEDRSFGVLIEDFTPTGEPRIVITYLPLLAPIPEGNRITNIRVWKEKANNATYQFNDYMTDVPVPARAMPGPFGGAQQYEVTSAPAPRTMTAGQTLEFEFSIFLPSSMLTTPGSRDTYYSDSFRYVIGEGGLTPNNTDLAELPGPLPPEQLGGDTTVAWLFEDPEEYFEQMALNMQVANAQTFLEGRRLFYTSFMTGESTEVGMAPLPQHANKVGPLMNSNSCVDCHLRSGSGEPLADALAATSSTVFKLHDAGDLGEQLRLQQGSASRTSTVSKTVTLADGTAVVLNRPTFAVTSSAGDALSFSPRLATPLIGVGLLESIDELTILDLADRLDCDGDRISGRVHFVTDPVSGELGLGRLGWKAETVSVAHQVATDASLSLGVGSELLPENGVELDAADFQRLVTYAALLGTPPQRTYGDPRVAQGEAVFESTGCTACHLSQLTTGKNHPFVELREQTIRPFTDLLLHDMGPDMADETGIELPGEAADPSAPPAASEWRTAPLWGVGLREIVSGRPAAYLHDGRAASLLEAILWHGGEAAPSAEAFAALPTAQREALLAYVASL